VIDVSGGTLKSILERLMLSIEDCRNPGLGTLNRLFMAAELVHLSKSDWSGLRAALIEELEAHLHPQAQMKVIEELQRRKNIQLILTSHSPNLTSKVSLKNLILCADKNAFPMGQDFTQLDPADYKFLECFLDVTKSNLFFAKGVILVEGWAEELLVPALAKLMKAAGVIPCDLTEAGVSVVNVGGLAYLRYAKIFLRKDGPKIEIPVSIITDIDVREYQKKNDHFEKRDQTDVQREKNAALEQDERKLNDGSIRTFVAPNWTLEYSLLTSTSLGHLFKQAFEEAHPNTESENLEYEVAKKLLNRGLKKQDIAYRMAQAIESNITNGKTLKIEGKDPGAQYLIDAIEHACGATD
jgi:putative ATP-dependent endonuclease of the OLD family